MSAIGAIGFALAMTGIAIGFYADEFVSRSSDGYWPLMQVSIGFILLSGAFLLAALLTEGEQ